MLNAAIWPTLDYSRVPYRLYHDPEAYEREQKQIFRGPTWSFLGLEAEIPNPGDFRTTYVGDTPVIVNRDANGTIHAQVNSLRPSGCDGPARDVGQCRRSHLHLSSMVLRP
jgi:anthranilate 1,2-dioxygenase large subunit